MRVATSIRYLPSSCSSSNPYDISPNPCIESLYFFSSLLLSLYFSMSTVRGGERQRSECARTNLWSIDTRLRSSLCLLLNMTSLCGISSKDGGPNGVHSANRPNGSGSSDLRFWPSITLIRPRTSSLWGKKKKKTVTSRSKTHFPGALFCRYSIRNARNYLRQ